MHKAKGWIPKLCVLSLLLSTCLQAEASIQDATILIDRALNSPTLTIRYSGAHVALVELRINGSSYGTRGIDPSLVKGETNFTIDLSSLSSGDNDVEVRLYDKDGKVVGSQKSTITTDEGTKAAVYMAAPKMGATVQGPVQLTVAFNKELKNSYVSFFIDNQFKSMTNSPPYSYLWDTTRDANGWHEVEAWAVDDTSVTYRTRRVKVFVNNPGGMTMRKNVTDPPAPVPTKPIVRVAQVPHIVASSAKLPVLPAVTSVPINDGGVSAAAAMKSSAVAGAQSAEAVSHAITPHVVAKPRLSNASAMTNVVHPIVGELASIKSLAYGAPLATGSQALLPTGKRMVTPTTPAKPAPLPAVKTPVQTTPAVKPIAVIPHISHVAPAVVTKPVQAVQTPKPVVHVSKPLPTVLVKPKLTASAPVHSLAAATMLRIGHGTKMPNIGTFPIVMDAKMVRFDQVKPRVQDGVPLTPFRYLFEQSGGKVGWEHKTKTVLANGRNREVYIKIGDKLAKVNNFPIEMDLAPFIDRGRTIIPISFLQDCLGVQVDYDPVTGHVLITSTKQK